MAASATWGPDDPAAEPDPRVARSRAAALSTAVDLLRAEGLPGLTVDRVSRVSGVAKTTIYRIWGDKSALVEDALRAVLPAVTPHSRTGPIERRVADILMASAAQMQDPVNRRTLPLLLDAWQRPDLAGLRAEIVTALLLPMHRALGESGHHPHALAVDEIIERLYGPLIFRVVFLDVGADPSWCRQLVRAVLAPPTQDRPT